MHAAGAHEGWMAQCPQLQPLRIGQTLEAKQAMLGWQKPHVGQAAASQAGAQATSQETVGTQLA